MGKNAMTYSDKSGFLLQNPSTHESRSVRTASMLMDGFSVVNSDFQSLCNHVESLKTGRLMPVGSVEFVRYAIQLAGFEEPIIDPYPKVLDALFHRDIQQKRIQDVVELSFVKPTTPKLFNGFVFDPKAHASELSEHDQEQLSVYKALPEDTLVWVSTPVKFTGEWRFYVDQGVVIGSARYDDGIEESPEPCPVQIQSAVNLAANFFQHGFALDIGVLENGKTALVEINDAWATGLYGRSVDPVSYATWLFNRWKIIAAC